MVEPQVPEWTLDGVLDELSRIDANMRDRQFAFILGAGASFTSGIPTGKDLAQRWLNALHLRECADGSDLDGWIAQAWSAEKCMSHASAAEHYPEIFERRFSSDREPGYAELENAMEGRTPSLGYSLLAEIIGRTRHKVVVTTNFDNLVADALAMHAHQSPLVVAHESLAGFVRPQLRRPLVAKIHRDLFLHPKNDQSGVSTMEEGWKAALKKLFQHFTPIVMGYGGNDGSLMDMLLSLEAGDIAGRMIWCYLEGAPPPLKARQVLLKHKGLQVKIAGFDEFMLELADKLVPRFDLGDVAERTERLGQERAARYRAEAKRLRASPENPLARPSRATVLLANSAKSRKNWWAWQMEADAEPDRAKREQIYRLALKKFPESSGLNCNFAIFLKSDARNYDAAERHYKKALELDPTNSVIVGSYANFLSLQRKDLDEAEEAYRKALDLDSSDGANLANYAHFLSTQRIDINAAESMFKQAIELEPNNPNFLNNYATFLADHRQDYDAAESLYKRAQEFGPRDAAVLADFARFLGNHRKDLGAADSLFRRARELSPRHAGVARNYAFFLAKQRKDYSSAEELYKQAVELDPSDITTINSYASFLMFDRKDYDAAEAQYKLAQELEPENPNHIANPTSIKLIRGDAKTTPQTMVTIRCRLNGSLPQLTNDMSVDVNGPCSAPGWSTNTSRNHTPCASCWAWAL